MKYNLVITLAIFSTLVGCGKSKSSSNEPSNVSNQRACSQATVDLYKDVLKQSERPITNRTRVGEISRSCETLQSTLNGQYCQLNAHDSDHRSNRDAKFISYADISSFCTEIDTYVGQRNPPRPGPIPPTPRPGPTPNPRPPRYDDVLVENLDARYSLYFTQSSLSEDEKDIRNSQTRCQLKISGRANRNLREQRARLVGATIQIYNGGANYDLSAALTGSNELVRLTCRSHDNRLSVQELNEVLNGVAEIRQRR